MSRIVIIGGHGKVALLLAELLAARGDEVISLIRDPAQAADVSATGATPLGLSVEEATETELAAALKGADAVVWSAGAGGKGGPARTDAVDRRAAIRSMEAARAAEASRYIMISWIGSHGGEPLAADHHLQTTGLDWTIVGPGTLTLQEPTGRIDVGRLEAGASGPTSRANVAAVVAAALTEPVTIGRVIPFRDGDTPIEQALADVPAELADLS